jgi:hypothetical protein
MARPARRPASGKARTRGSADGTPGDRHPMPGWRLNFPDDDLRRHHDWRRIRLRVKRPKNEGRHRHQGRNQRTGGRQRRPPEPTVSPRGPRIRRPSAGTIRSSATAIVTAVSAAATRTARADPGTTRGTLWGAAAALAATAAARRCRNAGTRTPVKILPKDRHRHLGQPTIEAAALARSPEEPHTTEELRARPTPSTQQARRPDLGRERIDPDRRQMQCERGGLDASSALPLAIQALKLFNLFDEPVADRDRLAENDVDGTLGSEPMCEAIEAIVLTHAEEAHGTGRATRRGGDHSSNSTPRVCTQCGIYGRLQRGQAGTPKVMPGLPGGQRVRCQAITWPLNFSSLR